MPELSPGTFRPVALEIVDGACIIMIHDGMSNVTPLRRPINWTRLRQDEAEHIIRCRAAVTDNVIFTYHAWDREEEREFTREDVFQMLLAGHCHDTPARNERGQWQVIMVTRIAGNREAGAVTVIMEGDEKLVVRTVEWMDVR